MAQIVSDEEIQQPALLTDSLAWIQTVVFPPTTPCGSPMAAGATLSAEM